jgi:nicotinamide-nucleotide amidase
MSELSDTTAAGFGSRTARAAAIVATGDELVRGDTLDTNSSFLARRLLDLGWTTERCVLVGDDEDALCELVEDLVGDHALVIVTGGLGPTLDDVTRHAIARAAGERLVSSARVIAEMRALFESRGRPFAQANERQALFPERADILPNPVGTAPGFCSLVRGALVFALPGPPRELEIMLENEVVPRLRSRAPAATAIANASFYLFGLSESVFADQCGAWMARDANPLIGVTASGGVLSARLRAAGSDARAAGELLAARAAEFQSRFERWIYSDREPEIAFVLARELIAKKISVSTAESCTGGLVAEKLTRVPGISAVFSAGFVTYANDAKSDVLGVDPGLIRAHGAVSSEVAEAMARAAAERSGARLAVSVTGIAGPDGGTPEKPVGLVWFGVSRDGSVESEERRFAVRGRDLIREFAANTALDLLRRRVP